MSRGRVFFARSEEGMGRVSPRLRETMLYIKNVGPKNSQSTINPDDNNNLLSLS